MSKTWLFSGNVHTALARSVAAGAHIPLGRAKIRHYPDGELGIQIQESIQDDDVFVLQPTSSSEAIMELLLMADALRRCRPRRLVLILPYFGYGRQERRQGQGPISAQVLARLLNQSGADEVMTLDLHAPQVAGFLSIAHRQLHATDLFAGHLGSEIARDQPMVVVSPDRGGEERAHRLNEALGIARPILVLEKTRQSPERCQVTYDSSLAEFAGYGAILVDDIISTGGTLIQAAQQLAERKIRPVWACVTHLTMPPQNLVRRLSSSPVERLYASDSLPWPAQEEGSSLHLVSVAPLLARAIADIGEERVRSYKAKEGKASGTRISATGQRLALRKLGRVAKWQSMYGSAKT